MLAAKLLCGVGEEKLYVDDVFSAYTYTGNSSTQTITNGVDLSGQGGLVWVKGRSGTPDHNLVDTVRGGTNTLETNFDYGNTSFSTITGFNSNGFTLGTHSVVSANAATFASWSFRKAAKFFDVVTWTGNATNRTIAHSLGQEVGMIMVKRTDTTADWQVYHRSLANTEYAVLNTTAAKATGATRWNSTTPTSSVFSLGTATSVNASGGAYVAYVFAHDTGTDGLIQCGTFTTDGSGNATVSLGWEPQYLMEKASSATGGWFIHDTSRGFNVSGTAYLYANTVGAESVSTTNYYKPTATGFVVTAEIPSTTYVYMAIRRPNKPPTLGTQVYNAIARTGNSATTVVTGIGFAPDLVVDGGRSGGYWHSWWDRLRGANKGLNSSSAAAEAALTASLNSFDQNGITVGTDANQWINYTGVPYINHFFKRASGVFDVVCYTGTGANLSVSHNLAAVPELVITKRRSGADSWYVYNKDVGNTKALVLDSTAAASAASSGYWNNTTPTSTAITFGTTTSLTTSAYVAYLFATKAGISKVGSFTCSGSDITVDCGFTTGARFVMIKRTDATGAWMVFDSIRGIVAANDPVLLLNSTAAEDTTSDVVDPHSSGFIVLSAALGGAGTYIYLSFA